MPFIITENCTGCTACIRRCPTDAITGERKLLHVIDPELCINCGACGVVCPDEAIYDNEGNLCEMLKPAARPKAYVDLQSCVGCEWCVWACPFDALVMSPLVSSHHFRVAEVIAKKCVGCTLCELDCPYDAIHIFRGDEAKANVQNERNARYEEEIGAREPAPASAEPDDEKAAWKDPAPEEEAPSAGPAEEGSAEPEAAEAEATEAPAPRKRKKKKRKKAASAEGADAPRDDAEEAKREDARREDVPSFAQSFPRDPELDALVAAFEQGNYARVRDEGPKLAKRTDRDEVRASARELVRRVEPDPLAVYLLAGTAALLVFLAGWYWSHPHGP